MRRCCSLALTAIVLATRLAAAEGEPTTAAATTESTGAVAADSLPALEPAPTDTTGEPKPVISGKRRALAIAAAVVPGFVVRGMGSWLVGEKRAAKRLAAGAVGGLVLAGGFGALVGISNGSPYTIPAIPLVLTGTGALLTTWAEDIWIAAGGSSVNAGPIDEGAWSVEVGETWQHSEYRERLLQRASASMWLGRFGAGVAGLVDTNGESWLAFADLKARVYGDRACRDCITVRAGGRLQRDRADLVTQLVGEVEVHGRLSLGRFDPAMRASFVELSTGIGANRITYASTVSEWDSLLLGRFAWGAYVPGGEVTVYYDHRRDGIAGGIDAWRAAGFMGSYGVNADVRIDGPWSLRGEFQLGAAYLSTLALVYRGGVQ